MPIYEYKCSRCDLEFEELICGKEESISCPECKSSDCKKQFSVFGFSAGNGFMSSAGEHCNCGSCGTHNCNECK